MIDYSENDFIAWQADRERLYAEIERLRTELERIADVSERWEDSLVSQINVIARSALTHRS